jgi:hypothetical protein
VFSALESGFGDDIAMIDPMNDVGLVKVEVMVKVESWKVEGCVVWELVRKFWTYIPLPLGFQKVPRFWKSTCPYPYIDAYLIYIYI